MEWEGRRLVDNGLMRAMPLAAARRLGAGPLVAVDVSALYTSRTAEENGLTRFWQMLESQSRILCNRAGDQAQLLIKPDVSTVRFPLTEEVVADCAHAGRRAVAEVLPALKRLLLSADDRAMLELAGRHGILPPEQAEQVLDRALAHPDRDLAPVLGVAIGPSALGLIRELAEHAAQPA